MEYKTINLVKEDQIAILTLNRPEKFNIVDFDMWQEMDAAGREISEMEDLRAVVLNAAGDHFSAGINLKSLAKVDSSFVQHRISWLQHVYSQWEQLWIPVVAAIQGLCYGSAMELILACDIRVCAANARLAIPEVRFGLSPDMGGTTRLTKLVGAGQAKRLIMACEEIDAQEAKAIGLVEEVVELDRLMPRAMELARKIASMPPSAVRMAKKGINLAAESSVAAGLYFEQAQSTFCCGTEDQKEAIQAFFEKRIPEFHGK